MSTRIYPIQLGFDHCYLIQSKGTIMVDGGAPNKAKEFAKAVEKVIYTPGHSSGSVSILLETGEAFVGDMAMNKFPLGFGPGLPVFAEDSVTLNESWRSLLDQGAKMIYPSHGQPFSADLIRKAIS